MNANPDTILAVAGLTLARGPRHRPEILVDDLSLTIQAGEMLALVGESGSGKSLSAAAVFGLLPAGVRRIAGSIRLQGQELTGRSERALRAIRGRAMGLVFQNPLTALNPSLSVQAQIAEVYRVHRQGSRTAARARASALLAEVGLQDLSGPRDHYPHQLSGGMRQRAMIAMALACDPPLLVADEPTTALDVLVQAQILALLARLQRERGLAILFITHDLRLAARTADRLLVLYAGAIMEEGAVADVFEAPRHPYTKALKAAIPPLPATSQRLFEIPGLPPPPGPPPSGCRFAPRCGHVRPDCRDAVPPLRGAPARFACFHPCQDQ